MNPRLFTTASEIREIKQNLEKYPWYKTAYLNLKKVADEMLEKGVFVPEMSGFVFYDCCKRDNSTLVFDPYTPYSTYCPVCGMRYFDEPHKRAWVVRYHHWLSQTSVLLGICYQIEKDEKYAALLHKILMDYSKVYQSFPNNDNELGPTRMAQSTYMESVFILYFAGGYDLVIESPLFTEEDKKEIETKFFSVSVEAILDYDEGRNNRQAFNNAGLIAVATLLNDQKLIDYALYGPNGFVSHMKNSVLSDGFWYEGDNYHFATVPSLVNIAEICLRNNLNLYEQSFDGHSIEDLFTAPLLSLQPDLTFPSRKDSRYKNDITQRWYAGLYELAYKRYKNPLFSAVLQKAYSQPPENKQYASAAGIMDIFAPVEASRSMMDWRGFLNMEPELIQNDKAQNQSVLLDGTGFGVLQRSDGTYVGLDYGDYGGGHGHPDRLNLNYFYKGKRWLTDFGTGSYYFDHLFWYRSTIGHNVIGVDGKTQLERDGVCTHFYASESLSLMRGEIEGIAYGVDMSRTVFLVDGLLIDFYTATSEENHQYHYALHSFGELEGPFTASPAKLSGDKYEFLHEVQSLSPTSDNFAICFNDNGEKLYVYTPTDQTNFYSAKAYGPPDKIPQRFPILILEEQAKSCAFVTVLEAREKGEEARVSAVSVQASLITVSYKNGTKLQVLLNSDETFQITKDGNTQCINPRVNKPAKSKPSFITNQNKINAIPKPQAEIIKVERTKPVDRFPFEPNIFINQPSQIRRNEKRYGDENDLSAEAMICDNGDSLIVRVLVRDDVVCFAGGKFPCDNDSIQLYIDKNPEKVEKENVVFGFIVSGVQNDEATKIVPLLSPVKNNDLLAACIAPTENGYEALIVIPWEALNGRPEEGSIIGFDLLINDRDSGTRRDLQAVWSGCYENERVYLQRELHVRSRFGKLKL